MTPTTSQNAIVRYGLLLSVFVMCLAFFVGSAFWRVGGILHDIQSGIDERKIILERNSKRIDELEKSKRNDQLQPSQEQSRP